MSRLTATVVVALGGFGARVAARLARRLRTRTGERPADLAMLELPLLDHGEGASLSRVDGLEDRLAAAVEEQLALSAVVRRAAADAAPPWLDVLVVGDLGEPAVLSALGPVLDAVGRVARERFGHVLGRDGGRVVAVPILALSGARRGGGPDLRPALDALAARTSPRVRSFLVEPQTERYLLSAEELVSTVVAMIELLALAALRDGEGLASFLRDEVRAVGSPPEPAAFGTFGVASVRLREELVEDYCRNRACLAVVDSMRAGAEVGLSEREALARQLRTPWEDVRSRLGIAVRSEAAYEQVEEIVRAEAPDLPCPPVELADTPETVRELKFGEDWHRSVCACVDGLVERMERRRMPELVDRIEAVGLALHRELRDRIAGRVDEWLWSEPRGWAAALTAVRLLRDEAAAAEEDARRRVADAELPDRPSVAALAGHVAALRGEVERRPRPFRMWLTGLLVAVPALLLASALLAAGLAVATALRGPEWLQVVLRPPVGLLLSGGVIGALLAFELRGTVRARHAELCEVRDELRRAMERLVAGRKGSVLAYYLGRLELARELWVLRLGRGERQRLEAELARLEEVQRALDTLREQLRAAQRRLGVRYPGQGPAEDLSELEPAGDLILREAASGELLAAAYAEAVEDEAALAAGFFEELQAARPVWRGEVPMADLERLEGFVARSISVPTAAAVLGRGERADDAAGTTARRAIESALSELSARLSPALEVTDGGGSSRTSWVVCAPAAAGAVVDAAVESVRRAHGAAFAADWLRLVSPRDDGQVYLAVLVTHLPAGAIATVGR